MELGWTYPVIDEMTVPEVEDIFEYWAENPPVQMMVASYLGVKKERPKRATKEQLLALAREFGG